MAQTPNPKSRTRTMQIYESLGPNEQAIIDKVKIGLLRQILIRIIAIKLQLQFKGWLQYLMPLPLTLLLFCLAGITYLFDATKVATAVVLVASALLFLVLFDVITGKFCLRFPESRPKTNSHLSLSNLMIVRKSCRSYQTRDLSSSDMSGFLASLNKHSRGEKIGAAPIRFEFVSAPITVWPVVNARHFVVAIAPAEYERTAIIDIGRCLQKVVIDATRMGLGTCWIGPGADHKSVLQHLGDRLDPDRDSIICLCAVGYKSSYIPLFIRFFNSQFHKRLPLSSLFFADSELTEPLQLGSESLLKFDRVFESCRWAPSSYNGQTTRCVATASNRDKEQNKNEQLSHFDFYAITASRYYAAVAVGIWCANWEMSCEELGIAGKFIILDDEQRGITNAPERTRVPRYDVSWMMNPSL